MTSKKTAAVKKKPASKASVEKKKAAVMKKIAAAKEKIAGKGGGNKSPRGTKKKTPDSTTVTVESAHIEAPIELPAEPVHAEVEAMSSSSAAPGPKHKQTQDHESGETSMAGTNNLPDDEGFGFFGDDDGLPDAADGEVIDLGTTLTIKNIEHWHEQLDKALGGSSNVRLEAGALEQIDGSGLQLLCSFVNSAQVLDISVGWGEMSTRFRQSSGYFGADEFLGLDAKKTAA